MQTRSTCAAIALTCLMISPAWAYYQADATREGNPQPPVEIPEEPRTIDPVTLVPPEVVPAVTVDFSDGTLNDLAEWIRTDLGLPVLFDEAALANQGSLLTDPVEDFSDDQPLYLLLDRLGTLNLSWQIEDGVLRITTREVQEDRLTTEPYLIGELLDADYEPDAIMATLIDQTPGPWFDIDGFGGTLQPLGDVLFVRQSVSQHREVQGALAALRTHGRETFVGEPPEHLVFRTQLQRNVSVDFDETSLIRAIEQIADQTGLDIRLDRSPSNKDRIREREPVSLTLADRKLETVLAALLADLKLDWMLKNGVMWVTTRGATAEHMKTVVYDVRDLCQNDNEATALISAIQEQTSGPWFNVDGIGGTIGSARVGTLVVRQNEAQLREIRDLLSAYRSALTMSKRRIRPGMDPEEILTRYYKMDAEISVDLMTYIPTVIAPGTWVADAPGQIGFIRQLSSRPEIRRSSDPSGPERFIAVPPVAVPQSVLIITQTRAVQQEIQQLIHNVEHGDGLAPTEAVPGRGGYGTGGMGGGGGDFEGGGFGGGFFSVK